MPPPRPLLPDTIARVTTITTTVIHPETLERTQGKTPGRTETPETLETGTEKESLFGDLYPDRDPRLQDRCPRASPGPGQVPLDQHRPSQNGLSVERQRGLHLQKGDPIKT